MLFCCSEPRILHQSLFYLPVHPFPFLTLVLSMYASCRIPVIGGKDLDLHHLFVEVTSRGGIGRVMLKFCPVLWKNSKIFISAFILDSSSQCDISKMPLMFWNLLDVKKLKIVSYPTIFYSFI